MNELYPWHMKFSIPQLKELEVIDKLRQKVITMRDELE